MELVGAMAIFEELMKVLGGGVAGYVAALLIEASKRKRESLRVTDLLAHDLHTWIENMDSKLGLRQVYFDSGGQGGSAALNLEPLRFEEQNSNIGKLNVSVARQIYTFLRSKNTLDTRMETIDEFAFDQDDFDESHYCEVAKLCLAANEIHAQMTKSHKDQRHALSEQQINKLKSNIDKIAKLKQVQQEATADWIEESDSPGTRQAIFPHELGEEEIAALKKSRMDPKHDHLNEELE